MGLFQWRIEKVHGNLHEMHTDSEAQIAQGVCLPLLRMAPMTLPWREIERELEEWARAERGNKDRPVFYLDRNPGGDVVAISYNDCDLNLTSLARRLADTLTLRLVEPASVASARLPSTEGLCPNCGQPVPKGVVHTCL